MPGRDGPGPIQGKETGDQTLKSTRAAGRVLSIPVPILFRIRR